ncbi:hypothetical protein TNIN_484101 [Trichonephila inaurata madagascariensis]|uniref:Uncharacterized protein n=1 Tax=Trichonephila inaurata madagascariensis TaxID=2747483 RepID=A0A8X6JQC7_9ARAC|nr:hypothetical protein TNIN_484101 [Trichonephila inaurata madagascariensis]
MLDGLPRNSSSLDPHWTNFAGTTQVEKYRFYPLLIVRWCFPKPFARTLMLYLPLTPDGGEDGVGHSAHTQKPFYGTKKGFDPVKASVGVNSEVLIKKSLLFPGVCEMIRG